MTAIPTNLARVPNMLTAGIMHGALSRTNADMFRLQVQLTTGQRINRPSDDAIGTSAVTVLEDIIERRDQRLRNLSHGEAVLNNVDAALGDLSEIVIEAKGIAASQLGLGVDAETRANQARVIDAMLDEVRNIANRKYQKIHLFGGNNTAEAPIQGLGTGLRYVGEGSGINTDLGFSRDLAINMSGEQAFGALSARVQGANDMDPIMTGATRLVDLGGARGQGVALASVNVDVAGTDIVVDLTNAHTVQDVLDTLQTEIQTVDAGAMVTIDPGSQNRIQITAVLGPITITDPGTDATAADLGIAATFPVGSTNGADVDPKITELTPLADLPGLTLPLGMIRLENNGQSRDLDLSGATTVQDVQNLVEGLGLGIRVDIADTGDRLNFVNEVSGGLMSIGEVAGGTTATELGVRSYTGATDLALFNDGLGVQIRAGSVDPISGLPDPAADLDFQVTLKDARTFDVDLAGATTVQDVLDAINAAAAGAGVLVPAEFSAGLVADGNGIALTDNTGPGTTTVTRLNGSFAAADLGIEGSTTGATLVGEDRARVAVDSVFSHLMSLRDALIADDDRGITLAGEKLEQDISRAAETRAEVGVRSRRISDATLREEDLRIQDLGLKSEIKDLDFTDAAMRFSLLQTQLQAALSTASRMTQLSLLDFIG
ncbi:MAG: flagellin N-terminal helical domain-containing protein [Planctomycetota bacterium]|jgi:flagellar hook-associated protein 3 FlgL